jgi:hypothetical protein
MFGEWTEFIKLLIIYIGLEALLEHHTTKNVFI